MSFVSAAFVLLYLAAIILRLAAYRSRPTYVVGLLGSSWIFYAWHVPHYMVLILVSTAVDYVAARRIDSLPLDAQRARRGLLFTSMALNLGLLAYFKYAGFLVEILADDAQAWSVSGLVLPIGISFYTFQSMSYTIDVYRRRIPAESSFLRLALYVAFFPQLVAGPIVRARDFLYQLDRPRRPRLKVFAEGAYLIVRGLFLKVVVADNLGVIVDESWRAAAAPGGAGGLALSMVIFFAAQLFCDFAGYTDIARGLAYQLGFRLPINFAAPYIATSFRDFWQRWHITLSTWFRDYLYIPLGGNRRGAARSYGNLVLVLLIAGLWHGANWTFVIWGGVHGLAVAVERALGLASSARNRLVAAVWYVVVQLTWILSMGMFRAEDADQGARIVRNALAGLTAFPQFDWNGADWIGLGWWLLLPVLALHLRALLVELTILSRPKAMERSLYAGAMVAAIVMLYTTSQQFIYFQF